jgi:hypothetical protein
VYKNGGDRPSLCLYAAGPLRSAVLGVPETLEIADRRRRAIAALRPIENLENNFHYE